MKVIKRNGHKIDFNPNKILTRIKKQTHDLKVNADEVFIKVTQGIADNMTTSELDELIAIVCESLAMNHPDYSKLAANICISKLHKETEDSFMKATKKLYNAGILNDVYYNKVKEYVDVIESVVDYTKDFNFDYFGWCSLKDIYLLKIGDIVSERPQQMYIRVALTVTDNVEDFKEYFRLVSNQMISPATPIKINAGTKIGQLASCFDEDTEVYIQGKGLIPIKDVKIGDYTFTHNNNLKKITNVWVNEVNDREVVKFEVKGSNPIICTSNHEFFSIRAYMLNPNDMSWIDIEWCRPNFIPIEKLNEGDFIQLSKSNLDNHVLYRGIPEDSLMLDGLFFTKITKKEIIKYNKQKVYNLEVEDDHSYTVEGIIAKNCNLSIVPDDSTDGLLSMLSRLSISSSKAEGIGLAVSNIRSKESPVGNSNGKAGGVLKYLKIVNEALRFWNQRGKRPGSCAIYIEPWHKDVFDVLDIRKKTGDEALRARDLFTALWIPDNFMRAVETNSDWYLFCPHDIKLAGLKPLYEIYGEEYEAEYNKAIELGLGKKIKAHDLWLKILESQIETGIPYILFKDHANNKTNHKNIGTIKSSNLCCLKDDSILTIKNNQDVVTDITIKDVTDKINNGESLEVLSENNIFRPILAADLMKYNAEVIEISDDELGVKIICTSDHLIMTKNRGYVMAGELKESDELIVKGY